MSKRFVYGHLDDGSGAGFLRLDPGIRKEYCHKYLSYEGIGNVTRVNYDPMEDDVYMLVFTTKLPQGSSAEKREQIFVDGYCFTKEEVLELMEIPEKLFETPFYASLDDYKENVLTTMGTKMDKEGIKKKQAMAYFYSILNNTGSRMEKQLLHVIDPFTREKWQKNLVSALKNFPVEIRIGISFCVDPYSASEINDSEWNFVSAGAFNHFVATGYEGARNMDRYIVTEGNVEEFNVTSEKRKFWEDYKKKKEDIFEKISGMDADRKTFIRMLTDMMKPEELPETEEEEEVEVEGRKSRIRDRKKKHTKRVARVTKRVSVVTECLLLLTSIAYLAARFYIDYKPAIPYMNIRVDNSVLVFAVQFVVAFCAVAVVGQVKKMVKEFREKRQE